jgi:hypothetical protein
VRPAQHLRPGNHLERHHYASQRAAVIHEADIGDQQPVTEAQATSHSGVVDGLLESGRRLHPLPGVASRQRQGRPEQQDTVGWAAWARHGGPRPSAGAAPPRHSALPSASAATHSITVSLGAAAWIALRR